MNIFVLFPLCAVAVALLAYPVQADVSEETKTMASQNMECFDETGITLEQLEELSNYPSTNMAKSGRCYIKCIAEMKGLEKDGVLLRDPTVEKRPDGMSIQDAEVAVEECSQLASDDACEASFLRYLCVFEKGENRPWLKPE